MERQYGKDAGYEMSFEHYLIYSVYSSLLEHKGGVQKKEKKNLGIFLTSPDPPTHPPTKEKKIMLLMGFPAVWNKT